MQAWADRVVTDEDYHDLRARLRSKDDYQFRSAFLELYVHECLLEAGYDVTVHPQLEGTSRRPDFLAVRGDERIYFEAIAPGVAPADQAAASRRGVLFDTVNRLADPNFNLWLDDLVEGASPPSAAKLRQELGKWLSQLNPDDYPRLEEAPEYRWQRDDWAATFKAMPKAKHARGPVEPGDRAIGVYAHEPVRMINDAPAIRDALATKQSAYGDVGAPFCIVVGMYIWDTDHHHSTNALYGHEGVQFGETLEGARISRLVREPNGFFGAPPMWAHRNVSGVLLVNQLQPYSVPRADVTFWRHPDPHHDLPADFSPPGVTVELVDGVITETEPRSGYDFFRLPEPWPPGEAWPDD